MGAFGLVCSAKDALAGTNVAIKKIMKPFSTPVLSKRTYRELKLLKHIQHENVSPPIPPPRTTTQREANTTESWDSPFDLFLSLLSLLRYHRSSPSATSSSPRSRTSTLSQR
jgi:serine/threonine protein kinase